MNFNFKNFFNTLETEAKKRGVLFNMTENEIEGQIEFESADDFNFSEIKSIGMPFSTILEITILGRLNNLFFTCNARIRTNVKMDMDEFSTTFEMDNVSIEDFDKIQKVSQSFKIAVKTISEDMIKEIVKSEEYCFEDDFIEIFEERRKVISTTLH